MIFIGLRDVRIEVSAELFSSLRELYKGRACPYRHGILWDRYLFAFLLTGETPILPCFRRTEAKVAFSTAPFDEGLLSARGENKVGSDDQAWGGRPTEVVHITDRDATLNATTALHSKMSSLTIGHATA